MKYEWLTTAPKIGSPATGHDAGQRGWRLHAVPTHKGESFLDLRMRRALCGLWPRHGWSLDMFIDQRCTNCERKIAGIG